MEQTGSTAAALTKLGPLVDYPRDVILFRQGYPPRYVFLVKSGVVKQIVADKTGKATIVGLRFTGSLVGSAAAIVGSAHVTTAATLGATCLHCIPAPHFVAVLASDLAISAAVHRLHAEEVRDDFLRSAERSMVARRRIQLILARLWLHRQDSGDRDPVEISLSHQELAQMASVTREHCSRILARLERDGIVLRHRHAITIPASSRLAGMARDIAASALAIPV